VPTSTNQSSFFFEGAATTRHTPLDMVGSVRWV